MIDGPSGRRAPNVRYRRPTEADYPVVAALVDEWWDGRVVQGLLPRLWFRHFAGTSWLAESPAPDGSLRIAGFLAGFLSQQSPELGVIQAVGVGPAHRRRGIGRALVDRFIADAQTAGRTRIEALSWPGNRRAIAFMAALEFRPDGGPGSGRLYGIESFEGYDFGTEDRVRFVKEVAPG